METEEVVANLLATVEHLYDLPDISPDVEFLIRDLRFIRADISRTIADEVDTDWHCTYKHLLLAKRQLKEVHESLLPSQEVQEQPFEIERRQFVLGRIADLEIALQTVRNKYYKVDLTKVDDPACPKCTEDYLLGKK